MHFRISGRWLAPVLTLLSACDLFTETEPPRAPTTVPRFESFGMTQSSYQVRPYTCGRATLRMVADRKIERDDIVWSADTKLVDLEDLSYETEVFGVAPTQGEDTSIAPSGRYQCAVSETRACRKALHRGGEQCVQLEQASGGGLKTAQSAAMLNDTDCLLGDASVSRLWSWPTETQSVTLQTHLVSSDANDIIRFERLGGRSVLVVTRRLFVWKIP